MTLHRFVIDAAAAAPDRPAVVGPAGSLTYRALDDRANALAGGLRARGGGRGDRIVLWGDKSPELVAATQAVLRLGAAYAPADRNVPAPRVAAMVRDCAARAVVTDAADVSELSDELPEDTHVLDLAAEFEPPSAPVDEAVDDDTLAYVLYTSGSTGKPKGVRVSHGNATAFVDWAVGELRATPADRFANHAPLTFDLSVLDLYAAFSSGHPPWNGVDLVVEGWGDRLPPMKRAWAVLPVALVALVVLAGCGGAADRGEAPGDGGGSGGDGGGERDGGGDVLVVRVTGGIAGVNDVVTVAADGAVSVERRSGVEERRLGEPELAELTALLHGSEFAALPSRLVGEPVADGFQYEFEQGGRTVTADQGSLMPPLDEILTLLDF
ncbi:AMP-binding protein [Streptomyces mayteni]